MSQGGNPTWLWFGLGVVCIVVTAVQFFDLFRRGDVLVDLVFFFLALGLAIVFMRRWSAGDHGRD